MFRKLSIATVLAPFAPFAAFAPFAPIATIAAFAALALTLGCIPGTQQDESSLSVLEVRDGKAVVEYYREWSGFTVRPSSVWEYEPLTDKADRVQSARRHFDLQVHGDYYAAEIPLHGDSSQGSRIVGGRFSTGREVEITTRDAYLEGRIDRAMVLAGDRVVVRTDTGLLVYSLSAEKLEKSFSLTDKLVELLAAGGHFALATRDNVHSGDRILIDLDSGDVREFPAAPDGRSAYFHDAVIADSWIVTGAFGADGADGADGASGASGPAILEYSIGDGTWRVLTAYAAESRAALLAPPVSATVSDADETRVLISRFDGEGAATLELLDRITGATTVLTSQSALSGGTQGILRGERVYWTSYSLDPRDTGTYLNSYVIDTGVRTTWPINVPKND